ncbi:microtubule-associated protein 65-2 [Striga asiatica]|uniref:Microtubule-associated protein 65-2 n=1 Tax=Striga asiatica TaxID=4170 RepID=A0A5A7PT29_STRAF|nr:microtubule-associated protein 65-2 [Striga asiatica]
MTRMPLAMFEAMRADPIPQALHVLLPKVLQKVPLRASGVLWEQSCLPLLQQLEDQGRFSGCGCGGQGLTVVEPRIDGVSARRSEDGVMAVGLAARRSEVGAWRWRRWDWRQRRSEVRSNDLYQSRRSSRLRPRVARLLDSLISCAVNLLLLRKDCKVGCVGWRYGKRRLRRKTIVAIGRSASDFYLIRTTPRIDILWANDSSSLRMTRHLCVLDTYTWVFTKLEGAGQELLTAKKRENCFKKQAAQDVGLWISQKIKKIWDEIGEADNERDKMLFELEQECLDAYRKKVDQASRSQAQLRQAVANAEARLQTSLLSGSLKKELQAIMPLLEDMKKKRNERKAQFSEVLRQINCIAKELSRSIEDNFSATVIDEHDLSMKRFDDLRCQLTFCGQWMCTAPGPVRCFR